MNDAEIIEHTRCAAEGLRLGASISVEHVNDLDAAEYLDEFARALDDAMACLTAAKEALERNERLRDTDPKGRRKYMATEPAKSWE